MENNYARAMFDGIVVSAIEVKNIVNKAISLLGLSPLAADALGRTLAVGALMGKQLKNADDSLTVTVKGDGILGNLTVCSDAKGHVKGTVGNPSAMLLRADGSLDVNSAVGKGSVVVVKDVGLTHPYVGTSEIVSGGIAEDFANYFASSEQQPCALTIGVAIENGKCVSGGAVLVQVMPGCDPNLLDRVETTLYAMDEMSYQFRGSTARQVLERFFSAYSGFAVTDESRAEYRCDCSEKRIRRMIKGLGYDEATAIIADVGKLEVTCHFCNKKYCYTKEDVDKMFDKAQ